VVADARLREITTVWGCSGTFMPSLARGLDYYNGLVFEVKMTADASSIVSGGRYDGLIPDMSLMGVSFGVSRILALYPECCAETATCAKTVYVIALGNIARTDMFTVIEWARGKWPCVKYEMADKQRKLTKILAECGDSVDDMVIVAETEWKTRSVIVKNLTTRAQTIVSVD
jgi:histidyl-tRNA synthetase